MAIQFDDILAVVCSEVKPALANDFQRVYSLSTATEAKLAFDILVAYGFDVKVYHQPEKMSKLYITSPTLSTEKLQEVLSAAMAYAQTLKHIKQNLDGLCSAKPPAPGALEYSMTFSNVHPNGKQLLIQVKPASATAAEVTAADYVSATNTAGASATAAQISSAQPRLAKKTKTKGKGHYEEFSSGPEVGRGKYPGKLEADGTSKQNSVRRRIMLYLFGNMATSSFAMFIQMLIVGIVFSLFVFFKAMICPDFAYIRSNAWYCHYSLSSASSNEDEAKRQREEQQRKIGLQPVQAPQ